MKTFINISIAIILSIWSTSCQERPSQVMEAEPHIAGETGTLIRLTKAQTTAAEIVLGTLEQRAMFQQVQVNGYFDVPPQNKAQVSTYKAGYVKNTTLLVGDEVKKGQVLVVLENPEYVKVQQSFMEVKGQLEYLKAEYERKKILEQENITAKKNLLKAEADYKTAFAQYQGLKKELQMMGISADRLEAGNYLSTISVRSPIAGTVTEVNAAIGKYILPQEVLLEVVNTDHLHVELQVFEKDILKVKEGQRIKVRIPSMNDKAYDGDIYLVGKTLDSETRTVNVHGHVQDEEAVFLPGMYVETDILVEGKEVSALPEEAVISEGGKQFIFIQVGTDENTNSYKKVEVKTGFGSKGWLETLPLEPLDSAQRVVVKGVYYLSSNTNQEGDS